MMHSLYPNLINTNPGILNSNLSSEIGKYTDKQCAKLVANSLQKGVNTTDLWAFLTFLSHFDFKKCHKLDLYIHSMAAKSHTNGLNLMRDLFSLFISFSPTPNVAYGSMLKTIGNSK